MKNREQRIKEAYKLLKDYREIKVTPGNEYLQSEVTSICEDLEKLIAEMEKTEA